MALEEFDREPLSNRDKNLVRMRSMSNYVMGILILGAGILFLFPPAVLAKKLADRDPAMVMTFGILCIIYGLFRIYRGYKKNYFRDS